MIEGTIKFLYSMSSLSRTLLDPYTHALERECLPKLPKKKFPQKESHLASEHCHSAAQKSPVKVTRRASEQARERGRVRS